MQVVNLKFIHSDPGDIAVLTAYMNVIASASFDDIRNDVEPLSGKSDGELAQIAQDAGFEVEPG